MILTLEEYIRHRTLQKRANPTLGRFIGEKSLGKAGLACDKKGKLECEQMPHKETIRVLEIADKLRSSWGVFYPFAN